ncbi:MULTISPECIES: asparaginase domain-containing protein [Rhizobium]|uniref:Asparaginase n=1 Tax=Rhizobium tropici TaxID=398 RepID=A0A6P1CHL4_RHITR|nr:MULTISPECIES: asparaginase domain-containing protein [Rhizobium]AGB73927.1 putative asparaginase/glutaminase [Rhizobium tropici CIAT 899]MBB4245392.1 L-asparaginase/Glu-tRNA(Gln) amidotransferase subunit D [Rhizobium tropici]MBB5596733.1 L-asparaginase/Glu-tRNA(Gln) amidotransferase subunit D [Rhizobium tropici]MBB6495743.1 L-asparaginase/Glu-tRNA(Gln) amidotransferase subunit D [Rhizobium tropici]NEV15115.1 asparaginase [Rhizobium tropici]
MRIGLLNCGGTITENYQPDGSIKRLLARDLIELDTSTDWIGHDVDAVDSCDLNFKSICRARDVMRQDQNCDAFVLCCGTDAMEDVAYAAALLFDRDRPVVLTGAAIPGGDANADGPRNLKDAARLAKAMPQGAAPLVCFAGRIFDPSSIVKVWPQAIQPFGPDTALRGSIDADIVTLTGFSTVADTYADLDVDDLDARVAIVSETFGAIAGFPDISELDGIVLAGKGAGGFSAQSETRLREAARRIPVVLSTRCAQGIRVNPAVTKYAYQHAQSLGMITTGYDGLNASKARIRLIAELGHSAQ